MFRLLKCEYLKLKRSKFLLLGLISALIIPFLVTFKAVANYYNNPENVISLFSVYDDAFMFLMLLFAPIALTIIHTWIVSREYTEKTLKNILVIPVSKTKFLCGKLLFLAIIACAFMLISWLVILALAVVCGCFIAIADITVLSAIFFLFRMLLGGTLLCATQTPFIYLTIRSKGFVAPLIAIAAVSLINVVLSNSLAAGFYPWSASDLLVTGRLSRQNGSPKISIFIIVILCILGIVASLLRFKKEEVD